MVVIPHPNQERTDSVVHVGPVGGMVSYKKPISNEEVLVNVYLIYSFYVIFRIFLLHRVFYSCHCQG